MGNTKLARIPNARRFIVLDSYVRQSQPRQARPGVPLISPTTKNFSRSYAETLRLIAYASMVLENTEKDLGELTFIISSMDSQLALALDANTSPDITRAKLVKLLGTIGAKVTSTLETLQKIQSPT